MPAMKICGRNPDLIGYEATSCPLRTNLIMPGLKMEEALRAKNITIDHPKV
jgi:hypothetical protein